MALSMELRIGGLRNILMLLVQICLQSPTCIEIVALGESRVNLTKCLN